MRNPESYPDWCSPEQVAKAMLLGVQVRVNPETYSRYVFRKGLALGKTHIGPKSFPNNEAALKVAANPAKYEMYWP